MSTYGTIAELAALPKSPAVCFAIDGDAAGVESSRTQRLERELTGYAHRLALVFHLIVAELPNLTITPAVRFAIYRDTASVE